MDYEVGDTIDLQISYYSPSCSAIFRFVCQGEEPQVLNPNESRFKTTMVTCPACGGEDITSYTLTGFHCNICGVIWKTELGASCLECGRALQPMSADTLLCTWCGQRWLLETIQDAYTLGDHESQIDWTIKKGANR